MNVSISKFAILGIVVGCYLLGYIIPYSYFYLSLKKALKRGYKGVFYDMHHKYYSNDEAKPENRVK